MKIKKEFSILVVVILALALYLIMHTRDRTHYTLPEPPHISKKDISKMEISGPGISIVLNKKDKRWNIAPQGYPADTYKVSMMLDIVEKLTLTALVSESKNYNRYDLDDDKKITVRAWTGKTLIREFEVGKAAMSCRHTFVKIAGDEGVYHAEGDFRSKFDHTVENLRDRTVLSFEKTDIDEIRITKGQRSMTFSRKEAPVGASAGEETDTESPPTPETKMVWQGGDGDEVDESRLNRFLTTLSNLRCDKYLDDCKKSDFTNPIYTLCLKGMREHTLSIFDKRDKDDKDYPAISSTNDYPFVLFERQADDIMKKPDEFLKKPDKS